MRGFPGRALLCRAGAALGAALVAGLVLHGTPAPAQETTPVLVVSRERVLDEATPAEKLNEAEAAMTADLQSRVDALKAELAEEEHELTRLRGQLASDEFDRRVRDFDQRVRREREITHRRAAALQTAFRQARQTLVEALVPILVTLSQERGAKLVLDSDQILVAHPSIDVTDEAIAMMARVPMPTLPTLEALPPLGEELPGQAEEPAPGAPAAPAPEQGAEGAAAGQSRP